jgi:hypothetical protein
LAGVMKPVPHLYGIAHDFEIDSGTHTTNVAIRFQGKVLPFFSRTLSFEATKR